MDAKLMWIWLAQACGQGSRTAIHLLCAYGSPEKIYRADRKSLAKKLGERELSLLNRLSNKDLSDATSILRRCKDTGVGILTPDDSQYPRTLYQLRDAPIVLYYVGKLPDFESFCCCAVVGTRTMSEYGNESLTILAADLVPAVPCWSADWLSVWTEWPWQEPSAQAVSQ